MEEAKMISTYDFVHLVLLASGGKVLGRTKLQKTVYFTGVLAGHPGNLGYRAHYYGPYSSEVSAAVDELRGLGFLKQDVASGNAFDSRGFEIARYDYILTFEGNIVADEKVKLHPDEWRRIEAAVKSLGTAKTDDYVKLSIAAKAHFMSIKENVKSPEEWARKSSKYGWQVSEVEFREADDLLRSINLSAENR